MAQSTDTPSLKLILATLGLLSAAVFVVPATAGIHKDGHGGAVCKGSGSCLVLQLDCKGKYTDATQKDGTVYGKCDQLNQRAKGLKSN